MSATREGGLKAAKTNKAKYGDDFYKRIGATGGKVSRGGGFAHDPEMARLAGRLGGLNSRKDNTYKPLDVDNINQAKEEIKYHKSLRQYGG